MIIKCLQWCREAFQTYTGRHETGPRGSNQRREADQFFQALKLGFWFSVYIDGAKIVDGAVSLQFFKDFHQDLQSDFLPSFKRVFLTRIASGIQHTSFRGACSQIAHH